MTSTTSPPTDAPRSLRVWVVSHTHWDREWYRPFQEFRLRLVELMDALVEMLDEDRAFPHFMLDGQMAVIDDYLEIRPSAEPLLRKLADSGRVSMGPWYILMDEFLVSGETIVRDLQLGLERATFFGGAMEIGYLPDMFGHIAQMPQILRLAGMDRAVVWRGVPSAVNRARFGWSAPDGSEVLAEYLAHGYGNAARLVSDPERSTEIIDACVDELAGFADAGSSDGWSTAILLMNGTDHQPPMSWLPSIIDHLSHARPDWDVHVGGLADALEDMTPGGIDSAPPWLPRWKGELRSSARANLLMGVTSNRVDVKQAAARAERSLERRAEPLWALFADASRWPRAFLDIAWRRLIHNAAHDSICACSDDEVVASVLDRYAEARQLGDGLASRALDSFAGSLSCTGAVVVNLSQRSRSGVVALDLPGSGDGLEERGCQIVSRRPEVMLDTTIDGAMAILMMGEVRSSQVSDDTFLVGFDVSETSETIDVAIRASDVPPEDLPLDVTKDRLAALIAARPEAPVHVRLTQPPVTTVLAVPGEVRGFGWRNWEPRVPEHPVSARESPDGGAVLSNGVMTIEVDPSTGTFSAGGVAGLNRLVDGGDHGDTYNYSPPRSDTIVDEPVSVSVSVVERGPVRGTVEVERSYLWPEYIDDSSRARTGQKEITILSRYSLHADETMVRIETEIDNTCRDHRLRAHFPLPEAPGASYAECAFAVVERPLVAEGGPTERGLATYPCRRFVTAGGLTLVHEGLLEYEVVDDDGSSVSPAGDDIPVGRELALTLLRATGMLSRIEMTYRPLPAGPFTPLAGAQVLGPHLFRYAVAVGPCDPYALADDLLLPLEIVTATGSGSRPPVGHALEVLGAEVSCLRRTGLEGTMELRVFNPRPAATEVIVRNGDGTPRGGSVVDLRGIQTGRFTGSMTLAPFKIATVQLDS